MPDIRSYHPAPIAAVLGPKETANGSWRNLAKKPYSSWRNDMRGQRVRRGQATVQWIVVAGIIFLAVLAGIAVLGTSTSSKMNETATDVADPASLKQRFGKSSSGGSGS
jgi:hypothetical protein